MSRRGERKALKMEGAFNGRLYGPLGYTADDGEGVCFNFYDLEQKLKRDCVYRPQAGAHRIIKDYLMVRDNASCKYCGRHLTYREATVDHFYPPEMWRKSEINLCDSVINLVLCCYQCNFVKGKKSPLDWVVYDRSDRRLHILAIRFIRRRSTHIKLFFKGTRTLTGRHRGIAMYRAMSSQERKTARFARFKDD